jgi:hypothetical protein
MKLKLSKGMMIIAFVVAAGIMAGIYWFLLAERDTEKMPARGIFVYSDEVKYEI